ncbi:MAG: hypothetical protein SGI77_01660 [Pirellulaceae bacterium]|nr:hypothetical protein [Pirellulaceae bacterium]
MKITTHGNESEQSDPPKSRSGRFLMVSFLAATSVIAAVIWLMKSHENAINIWRL